MMIMLALRLLVVLLMVSVVIGFYTSYFRGISIDNWLKEKFEYYFSGEEKHSKKDVEEEKEC